MASRVLSIVNKKRLRSERFYYKTTPKQWCGFCYGKAVKLRSTCYLPFTLKHGGYSTKK